MNTKGKNVLPLILLLLCCFTMLIGCTPDAYHHVAIGFKTTDSAAEYQESIDALEIGKTFYTCIKVKSVTNKKATHNYKVVIEVPRTNNIEVDHNGGLEADSNVYDPVKEMSVLEFTVKGSKEAVDEKILFKGTPIGEGEAKITVTIYNEEGVKEYASFRVVEFKYELQ